VRATFIVRAIFIVRVIFIAGGAHIAGGAFIVRGIFIAIGVLVVRDVFHGRLEAPPSWAFWPGWERAPWRGWAAESMWAARCVNGHWCSPNPVGRPVPLENYPHLPHNLILVD
jgi:hypothetical protein